MGQLRGLRTFVNVFAASEREVDLMLAASWHDPEDYLLYEIVLVLRGKLLLSIINEVLDMSKVESGKITLSEEEVHLAELIHSVVSMVQPLVDEKQQQFQIHVNDIEHESVLGDVQRLQQLIMNLLTNAIKYTPTEGLIRLDIFEKPSNDPEKSCYEFVVEDNGIGMHSEFLTRVFEPFERAEEKQIDAVQGTGLGLAICKSIAEKMGGSIQVESEYGAGSRFTASVTLRRSDGIADDEALRGLSVLVADDDEITCLNTCTRLEALGIRCEEEETAATIYPGSPHGGSVETYDDHRVAMAFSLIGLRTDGIVIENPACCRKTFENYFTVLSELTGKTAED